MADCRCFELCPQNHVGMKTTTFSVSFHLAPEVLCPLMQELLKCFRRANLSCEFQSLAKAFDKKHIKIPWPEKGHPKLIASTLRALCGWQKLRRAWKWLNGGNLGSS